MLGAAICLKTQGPSAVRALASMQCCSLQRQISLLCYRKKRLVLCEAFFCKRVCVDWYRKQRCKEGNEMQPASMSVCVQVRIESDPKEWPAMAVQLAAQRAQREAIQATVRKVGQELQKAAWP